MYDLPRRISQRSTKSGDHVRNGETIHKVVLDDRQLKVFELTDIIFNSKSAVHRMLTENLDMRKLCIGREPRLFTMEQKQHPGDVSFECLAMFRRN